MPNQKIELIDAIAIARGTKEPTNRDVFWLDKSSEGGFYDRLKSYNYDTEKWELVSRSSNELLTDLKTVDGAGSGLDSDTLRGYTPEQLISSGGSGLPPLSTGKIIVGQGDTIGQAKTLGGIATIDANGSMAYVTNSISHTGLTNVGTNTHVQIDSHIADSAIHLSTAQSTKLGHISVTQAVDLDQMETDITANNAKVTNATHTGDVTGSTVLTIADDSVTNAKSANVATQTIKGRNTAGTGNPEDLTATQVRTIINVEDGATADQTDVEIETAYNNQVSEVTQAEAEAGTVTTVKRWTPQRVKQAIDALSGGGGGNTIYTANDSLTGDRTVNLGNTYDLIFENSGSSSNFKLNNAANGYVLNNRSGGIKIRPSLAGNQPLVISNTSDNFNTFTIKANGGGEWSAYNGVKIGELTTNDYAKFTIYDLEFYKGNTIKHKIGFGENGSDVDFWLGGVSGNNSFRVGGNTLINSEAISLKGHTVIQGADTLGTSSALQIYDSDSTPSALWDFRNNGDVVLSKETTIRADYQEMLTLESSASNPSLVLNALNSGSNTNIEFARVNSKKWLIGNVSSNDSFRIFNYQTLTTPISISNANKINVLAPTTTTKNLNIGNTTLIEASDVTPLTVKSDANGNMQIEIDSNTTSYNSQVKYSQGGSEKWLAGVDNSQSFRFYNFGTSSTRLSIKSNTTNITLPTSSSGLSSGDLWNDGGTVKIV